MRRVISFLLVLALCLSMTCTAYATFAPSAGEGGTPSVKPPYSGDNPKTGDIILMWAIIMLLALIALIAVIVISRKVFR